MAKGSGGGGGGSGGRARTADKVVSEDDYVRRMAGYMPTASFIRSTKGMSDIALRRAKEEHRQVLRRWQDRVNSARADYKRQIKAGSLFSPTRIERLRRKARGHPDNAATQAARRLLAKRGLSYG